MSPGLSGRYKKNSAWREIEVGDPFAAFDYMNPLKGSHSIEIVYFAQLSDPPAKIILDPNDHAEYRWVSLAEAQRLIAGTPRETDQEWPIIQKGFALLGGASPAF